MKGSKSRLSVKAVGSQETSDSSDASAQVATAGARTHEDGLLSLVRLLARQAAREWVERQFDDPSPPTPPPTEKSR